MHKSERKIILHQGTPENQKQHDSNRNDEIRNNNLLQIQKSQKLIQVPHPNVKQMHKSERKIILHQNTPENQKQHDSNRNDEIRTNNLLQIQKSQKLIQVLHPNVKQMHKSERKIINHQDTPENQKQHDINKYDEIKINNLLETQKSQQHCHSDGNIDNSNKNVSMNESGDQTSKINNQDQLDKTNQSLPDGSVIHDEQQNPSFIPNNQSQSSNLREQTIALIRKYTLVHEQSDNEIEKKILVGTLEQLHKKLNQLENQQPPKALNSHEQIRQNLMEIYQFYARQTFINGKQETFEKLLHINHVLTLSNFMYFCKDFQIINLEFELSQIIKILQLQGSEVQQIQQSNQKKHLKYILPRKSIVDKQTLVELFKKSSSNSKELSFNEFEFSLQKIAEFAYKHILDQIQVTDQVKPNAIILFLLFLQIQRPSEYCKKMLIVGVPFELRDCVLEKISQEKLKKKSPVKLNIQSAAPKDVSQQLIELTKDENKFLGEEPKQESPQKVGQQIPQVKLEDMNNNNLNPKNILQDVDFDDQEDNIYLQEYSLKQPIPNQIIVVPEHDTRDRSSPMINYNYSKNKLSGSVDQSQSKQMANQGNYFNDDQSRDYKQQPKKDLLVRGSSSQRQSLGQETLARAQQVEMQSLKREQVLYQQLLKNQNQKQQKMIGKV